MQKKTVNILGTEYTLYLDETNDDNPEIKKRQCAGYCNIATKEIHIGDFSKSDAPELERSETLRHELLHAFITESGLGNECPWAFNEEMIDWFAIQMPKLRKTFDELGV